MTHPDLRKIAAELIAPKFEDLGFEHLSPEFSEYLRLAVIHAPALARRLLLLEEVAEAARRHMLDATCDQDEAVNSLLGLLEKLEAP